MPPPSQQLYDQSKTQQLLLHVGYHPTNVKFFEYQGKLKENILKPKYRRHLSNIINKAGNETKIDRMVVAYPRPPNKVNILSYRNSKLAFDLQPNH